ncbi:MAG: cupin domain-containing protein [Alphaproteobacteria bacterium]
MILDAFPTAEEFYETYWGKKPFIVRGYIPDDVINGLIDGDTMAGLALEDGVKSRIITNSAKGKDWLCEHGPFEEERFAELGERNWSLLVQNTEQYHTDTANLFKYFNMSPRWLIEDIMVSYSTPGGSVGPHTDSYHTFLVQGMGKRTWKISNNKIVDDCYIDNPEMKVLKNGFDGEEFEVTSGDVIYMPPFFGHEGKTREAAMTFSVGFLGPKLSEILSEYAYYLEENEHLNKRFLGEGLNTDSAGFNIAPNTAKALQDDIIASIQSDDFSRWLALYFSTPSHEYIDGMDAEENHLPKIEALKGGEGLRWPEHVKLVTTISSNGEVYVAALGKVTTITAAQAALWGAGKA